MPFKSEPVRNSKKKLKVKWTQESEAEDHFVEEMNKPHILEKTMTKFRVGYWRGTGREGWGVDKPTIIDYPDCPKVEDFIDPTWNKEERNKVVEYLGLGDELHRWCGYSTCRICGKHDNGDACLTDGKWVWPSGLAHYLMKHAVKPPQEFVDHALKNFDTFKQQWEDDLTLRITLNPGGNPFKGMIGKFLYRYYEGE